MINNNSIVGWVICDFMIMGHHNCLRSDTEGVWDLNIESNVA